jgi:hypothetical protein
MNAKLAATLVVGALILLVTGYGADTKSVKKSAGEYVGEPVISPTIKAEHAKDNDAGVLNIKDDPHDRDGRSRNSASPALSAR